MQNAIFVNFYPIVKLLLSSHLKILVFIESSIMCVK